MRKLVILKSLIDFIWFITCLPLALLALVFLVLFLLNAEVLTLAPWMDSLENSSEVIAQIYAVIVVVLIYVGIYCFYLFRKTIRYFMKVKPFHLDVIQNFNRIGNLLCIIGIVGGILVFLGRVVFESEIKINLGISPYLILVCMGLFFMVLSEVFKLAKHAKEENDLTV